MQNIHRTLSHGSNPGRGSEDGECAEDDQQSLSNSSGEEFGQRGQHRCPCKGKVKF